MTGTGFQRRAESFGADGIRKVHSEGLILKPLKLSKPIIDEIDRVLAQHYGFTDEELDFIINDDIKYRMGLSADKAGDALETE